MSNRTLSLVGQRFERLLVVSAAETRANGKYWNCICDCGNLTQVCTNRLTSGNTKSCGCYRSEYVTKKNYVHGFGTIPEYQAFLHAKQRCEDVENPRFKDYGGRGIEFRLESVKQMIDALGYRPSSNHSLDRINNNGHYEIDNLRWATRSEQQKNTRRGKQA